MLSFGLSFYLLFPIVVPPLQDAVTSKKWTAKNGHILDAKGKEIGVYGVDCPTKNLFR